jgi:hypothetical protein
MPTTQFDDEMRRSLPRREPPAGFADRVIAEMRRREAAARPARSRWWRWSLAAAAVLALSVAPLVYVQHIRETEGERAKAQVMAAFHVTGASLRDVQERVNSSR